MQRILKFVTGANYWSIIVLPFSVGIAPGFANAMIGIMIVSFLIEKAIKRERLFRISLPIAAFLLFILFVGLSFINTTSMKDSIHGMVKVLRFLLIFVVCSESIRDKKHFQRIAVSIAFAISLSGIDAIWQVFTGRDFIRGNTIQSAIGLPRATAAFPGCNGLGVYLTALTPIIAGLALFAQEKKWKIIFSMAALLGSIGVYLTLSRGAGIGLFLSVLFLSIIRKNKLITSILLILILVYPFFMPKNIKDWAKSVKYNPIVMLTDEVRIGIYRNTMYMISQHPFVGVGVNTFCRSYEKYRNKEVEATNPTADGFYAHNNFLHMAGEVGLLGLFSFLVFLFLVLKPIWRSFKKNSDPFLKGFSAATFAAIFAYLINGLTETSLYYSRIVMIFWFIIGLGLALSNYANKNEPEKNR